jgi:hypothetical protein
MMAKRIISASVGSVMLVIQLIASHYSEWIILANSNLFVSKFLFNINITIIDEIKFQKWTLSILTV